MPQASPIGALNNKESKDSSQRPSRGSECVEKDKLKLSERNMFGAIMSTNRLGDVTGLHFLQRNCPFVTELPFP